MKVIIVFLILCVIALGFSSYKQSKALLQLEANNIVVQRVLSDYGFDIRNHETRINYIEHYLRTVDR